MNELVDIYLNGEKHKAMIIKFFDIEDRTFCLYAIPNGDETFNVQWGKKMGDQIVDSEDENEKTVVDNIVKTILLEQKKEELLNMNDEDMKFTITDENGEEKQAYIIGEFEVDKNNYFVYAIDENEEASGLYAKKIIYNDKGEEERLESITDPEEKEHVFESIKHYINQEVGES